jgi:hypothetical protein
MNSSEKPLIKSLENRELAGVTFIRGYIQFLFDGPILNTYTLPRVITRDAIFDAKTLGYRDALCEQIGEIVTMAHVDSEQKITIQFGNGTSIEISLKDEDRVSAEAVVLQIEAGKSWDVW